jgi:hypothetical protein
VADWDQGLGAHVDVAHAWSGQTTDVAKISRTFGSLAPPICRVWLAPLQGRARVPARREQVCIVDITAPSNRVCFGLRKQRIAGTRSLPAWSRTADEQALAPPICHPTARIQTSPSQNSRPRIGGHPGCEQLKLGSEFARCLAVPLGKRIRSHTTQVPAGDQRLFEPAQPHRS